VQMDRTGDTVNVPVSFFLLSVTLWLRKIICQGANYRCFYPESCCFTGKTNRYYASDL